MLTAAQDASDTVQYDSICSRIGFYNKFDTKKIYSISKCFFTLWF